MSMNEMTIAYARKTAAHKYALGFVYRGQLYVVVLTFAELTRFFKLDRASSKRGGFAKIRIKLTSAERAELSQIAECLGAESLLTKDAKHNKGENFERELTERWTSETWVKDSVPFWVAGDIRVDGVEIQVKLDGAELTNEKLLSRLA
jgi:hypothetical protein